MSKILNNPKNYTFPATFCRYDNSSSRRSVAASFCHGDIGHTTGREEPRKIAFPQASTDFACIVLSIRVDIVGMADEARVLTIQEVGRRGGVSRAKNLSPEQRREIARRAAQARWAKKTDTPDPTDPNSPDGEVERRGLGIM
jgi:hypothetical protein